MLGSIIQAGVDLFQGHLSRKDQQKANRQNIALAREQMKFQERMRDTQYQAAAKDLEAAGLNRILALGGPSAAPSGATAHVEPASKGMQRLDLMAIASAKEAIENQKAQNNLIKAETRIKNAQADKEEITKRPYSYIDGLLDAIEGNASGAKDAEDSFVKKVTDWMNQEGTSAKDAPSDRDYKAV